MKFIKPKIIIIAGPTASGKSDLALQLAKKFNGEIISADSRQVYRGMDIGSGKVHGAWSVEHGAYISEGIAHYLIDVADPGEDFNVSHFKKKASEAINIILKKDKLPIVCGGTGFWIDALIYDTQLPEVKPNEELRSILRDKSSEELFNELQKLDPQRAQTIDSKNPVRLIRAIEIAKELGKVPRHEAWSMKHEARKLKYNALHIAIDIPREELNAKIKKRLEDRFDEGMIEEVENLQKNGTSWERLESFGLEYRWIARYLQNKVSLEEMKEKLYFDSIHYAKRQITWLKRNNAITWHNNYSEIELSVINFLQN